MTDSLLEAEVAAFLDKYMEAFGAFDGKAIAACYHVPVITTSTRHGLTTMILAMTSRRVTRDS